MRESKQMKQTANIDVAVVSPASATHYELEAEVHFANRIEVANAITEQIWREQQLVSNRMQWNFTFQAFLAGIYVFAGSNLDGWEEFLVQIVLAVVGLAVACFCLFGVIAAQKQSTRLKTHWANEFCKKPPKDPGECDITRGAFPQPFSKTEGSRRGRYASRGVCGALMGMWGAMLVITVLVNFVLPKPVGSGKLVCNVDAPANAFGAMSITCKSK
jgi:hypothetical protein